MVSPSFKCFQLFIIIYNYKNDHMTLFQFEFDGRQKGGEKNPTVPPTPCINNFTHRFFFFSLPPDNMTRRRRRRLHALKRPPGNCSRMKVICGSDMGSERSDTWITVFIKSSRRAVSRRQTHLRNINEGIINPAVAAALITPSNKRKIWWEQFCCFAQNLKKK